MDDDYFEKVLAVTRQNRRLTAREVAEEVGIYKSSCYLIFIDKRKMRHFAAKFVPRLLTDVQKENRVTVSQERFDRSNAFENFPKNVITSDETWAYDYEVEKKCSRRSGWENCRHDQTSTSESLKSEGDVESFFLLERYLSL